MSFIHSPLDESFKIIMRLVAKLCLTLETSWTVACQAPLSMRFSRQEYWSGLPFPSPGDLPDPRIEPWSPALQADSLPSELPDGSFINYLYLILCTFSELLNLRKPLSDLHMSPKISGSLGAIYHILEVF